MNRSKLIMAAAATVALPTALRAQTPETIRITAVPTDDMTPIFYAIKNGMYEKAGIDCEVVPASSGSAATTAVVAGAYELGKASPVASLLAHVKGLPLTVVANGAIWNPKSPFNLILVASDSPIRTAADCNGKIGAAPGLNDIAQLTVLMWVDKNGGDSKTMKWVEIPNSAQGAALAQHRVDLITLNEPQLSAAVESGTVRVLGDAFGAVADHWVASLYIANTGWAAGHGEVIKRWARVTYDAAAHTNANKAETAPMMSDITKIPIGVFQKMARIEGATAADPALLQPVIDLAVRYKALDKPFRAREMYAGS